MLWKYGGICNIHHWLRGMDAYEQDITRYWALLTFTPPESSPSGQFWGIYALIGGVRVKITTKAIYSIIYGAVSQRRSPNFFSVGHSLLEMKDANVLS